MCVDLLFIMIKLILLKTKTQGTLTERELIQQKEIGFKICRLILMKRTRQSQKAPIILAKIEKSRKHTAHDRYYLTKSKTKALLVNKINSI